MTDIRVNSVLPIAGTDSAKGSRSNSDFLFSLQSVSAADVGSKTSTPRSASTVKSTDNSRQPQKSVSNATSNEAKGPKAVSSDSTSKANITQKSSQSDAETNSGKTQNISTAANSDDAGLEQNAQNQQTTSVKELQSTVGNGAVQKSEEIGAELSELQNQAITVDASTVQADALRNQPMLDLNRILDRLGSFADGELQDALSEAETVNDNIAGLETANLDTLNKSEETISFGNGEKAPVIDLDRILEGLKSEDSLTETLENEKPIRKEQKQTALPQINFDRILKSVEEMQEGEEVIPSADRINAAEAEKPVKHDRASDSEKIAANVGLVWGNLEAVITAAAKELSEVGLQMRDTGEVTGISAAERVQNAAEILNGEDNNDELKALYEKFSKSISEAEKPTTLDQLKAKLAAAMMMAVYEMNDPEKQAEEQAEKILEFLLKFLEKLNGDDEEDKESALDAKKGGDLGILLQIIGNMIDEVRDGTQIADSEENVFEIAPAAAVKSAGNGYGVNIGTNINKSISTDNRTDRITSESKIDVSVSGAAEGVYAPVADLNAKNVGGVNDVNAAETLGALTVPAGQVGAGHLSKASEDDDEMIAKADKVLSRPNRDGTIGEPELTDEFAELKKLIDDMKKTHEDDEEEERDDEENEPVVGGKGVKGDEKSDIIRAVSIKASEPGETAIAKSFAEERGGAKQILSQIATEVLNNAPKEKRTVALVMTLTPENLGKVTLKITEQAGKLNVMVTAHNKETAEILASRMDGLQDALKDSGTQLEKYQVVYGPEENADARQQSYEGSSKNPYVRQNDEEDTDKEGDFSELLREAV